MKSPVSILWFLFSQKRPKLKVFGLSFRKKFLTAPYLQCITFFSKFREAKLGCKKLMKYCLQKMYKKIFKNGPKLRMTSRKRFFGVILIPNIYRTNTALIVPYLRLFWNWTRRWWWIRWGTVSRTRCSGWPVAAWAATSTTPPSPPTCSPKCRAAAQTSTTAPQSPKTPFCHMESSSTTGMYPPFEPYVQLIVINNSFYRALNYIKESTGTVVLPTGYYPTSTFGTQSPKFLKFEFRKAKPFGFKILISNPDPESKNSNPVSWFVRDWAPHPNYRNLVTIIPDKWIPIRQPFIWGLFLKTISVKISKFYKI